MDIELAQTLEENELLKSLLYCTKRSCNNCGKVNCENFQRQRIDCCGHWVSYKDYIKQLEAQIEKMKCCDNCKHFDFNEPNYCHKGVYRERQYVCSKWEFGN